MTGFYTRISNFSNLQFCSTAQSYKRGPRTWTQPGRILNDLCLANVISKYFSKLRFGINKIEPELNCPQLKCLKNIILSFYESLLRARPRLWKHELCSVCSKTFIATVCHPSRRTKFAREKVPILGTFFSAFWVLQFFSSDVKANPLISWNGHTSFQRIFPSNSRNFITRQPRGLSI